MIVPPRVKTHYTEVSLVESEKWPEVDASQIAPCKKGIPDLFNHLPSRLIAFEEAKARGWTYFFSSQSCRYGHQAPRYVSNPRLCVDCSRIKQNRPPIGLETKQAKFRTLAGEKPKAAAAEPETPRVLPQRDFVWDDEKRDQLVEVYVDTGSLEKGRQSINVSPSEYLRELARNGAFAEAVEKATPQANLMLEERAIQLALDGNDRLLQRVLAAKFPNQYRESVKLDINQTSRVTVMSDEAIEARILQLTKKREAIDVEVEEEPKQITSEAI